MSKKQIQSLNSTNKDNASHQKPRKYFGTDGVRGVVGQYPITPDFVLKLGWAIGKYYNEYHTKNKQASVLIGKDTRISGYVFESAMQAGLLSAGANISLVGPLPTPGIAYLTRTFNVDVGAVISASHNPFCDNGIKFFTHDGYKIDDDQELKIEQILDMPMETISSDNFGKASRINDATGRYVEFCKGILPFGTDLSRYKIVIDCANGAAYNVTPKVFSELGAEVHVINDEPDGMNINFNCGATNAHILQSKVLEKQADFGIALDGDGDRAIMVDNKGQVLDGDDLLYIIAKHRHENQMPLGGVIGTIMTNYGLEEKFSKLGIPFERAKVGDRYVISKMRKNNWYLGGESSGHVICADRTSTGDGTISSLSVVMALIDNVGGKHASLSDLKSEWFRYPSYHTKVYVGRYFEHSEIDSIKEIKNALRDIKEKLSHKGGRVILRPSGTEPIIRISVESKKQEQNAEIANQLVSLVKNALGV